MSLTWRHHVAFAVKRLAWGAIDGAEDLWHRAQERFEVTQRLRGEAERLAAWIAPCGCEPGIAFFCSHKQPPGFPFGKDCACECHRGFDERERAGRAS